MDPGKRLWDGGQRHGDVGTRFRSQCFWRDTVPQLTSARTSLWLSSQAKWGMSLPPLSHSASKHTRAAEEGSGVDVPMSLGLASFHAPCAAITSKYVRRCVGVEGERSLVLSEDTLF